jgi:hypothetical protein
MKKRSVSPRLHKRIPSRNLITQQPNPNHSAGQVPYRGTGAGNKSLLLLFFRKEDLSVLF